MTGGNANWFTRGQRRAAGIRASRAIVPFICRNWWWLAFAAVVLLGTLVRLWFLMRANWMLDADESIMAIVGRHIQTRGERPIFFPGQAYMGVWQAYLAALSFELFGVSRQAVKLVPLLSSAAFVGTTMLLARRVYGPAGALVAGVLAALPSLYLISTTLRASYPLIDVMALGNVLLLLSIDAAWGNVASRSFVRRAVVMGLIVGFGFWLHPAIVMYVLPAGLLLLLGRHWRSLLLGAPAALLGFVVGAAPVFQHARSHDYTLLHYLLGTGETIERDLLGVAWRLAQTLMPRYLGVSVPWQSAPVALQLLVGVPTIGAIALLIVRSWLAPAAWIRLRPQRAHPEVVMLVFGGTVLATYLLSRFSVYAVLYPTLDATGRYIAPLGSFLPLAVAGSACHVWRLGTVGRVVAALGVAAILTGTLVTYARTAPDQVFQSPYYRQLPDSLEPLIATLDGLGAENVWVEHWIGTPLVFDTDERIAAADYVDIWVVGGVGRLYETNIRVFHAEQAAFVFRTDAPSVRLEETLRQRGVSFTATSVDGFRVVFPLDSRVDPATVVDDLIAPE
ncbi:MAG TPA: glycosyltransferase family 39 protein [Thermomicrobiales bacterium]|nr:glycosyltransferase family 39 protein [Thermomicrobiales bacterium]